MGWLLSSQRFVRPPRIVIGRPQRTKRLQQAIDVRLTPQSVVRARFSGGSADANRQQVPLGLRTQRRPHPHRRRPRTALDRNGTGAAPVATRCLCQARSAATASPSDCPDHAGVPQFTHSSCNRAECPSLVSRVSIVNRHGVALFLYDQTAIRRKVGDEMSGPVQDYCRWKMTVRNRLVTEITKDVPDRYPVRRLVTSSSLPTGNHDARVTVRDLDEQPTG